MSTTPPKARSERNGRIRSLLLALIGLPVLGACSTPTSSSGVSLMGGLRQQGGQEYEDADVDEPTVLIAAYELKSREGGFGFEAGGSYAEDTTELGPIEGKSETLEAFIGIRYDFLTEASPVRPYVGVGGTYLQNDLSTNVTSGSLDADTFGGYAHAGATVRLTSALSLVVDVRGVFGTEYEFDGPFFVDGDYVQATAGVGLSF